MSKKKIRNDQKFTERVEKYTSDALGNDIDDYKMHSVVTQQAREECSNQNVIYVAIDPTKSGQAKVGMTTNPLSTRDTSTGNPDQLMLHAFKVKHDIPRAQVKSIEDSIHDELERHGHARRPHATTGRDSEWFEVDPYKAVEIAESHLKDNFANDMKAFYCEEREFMVIDGYHNPIADMKISGKDTTGLKPLPYAYTDISNPPISPECAMPPGCGADCDCWGSTN